MYHYLVRLPAAYAADVSMEMGWPAGYYAHHVSSMYLYHITADAFEVPVENSSSSCPPATRRSSKRFVSSSETVFGRRCRVMAW
jgi:hypothetical protein